MKRHAFTLIEIIVVIGLISLLSVVGLTAYNRVQANARDAKRMGDMQELRTALLLYKSLHNTFPTDFDNDCSGWDASSANSDGPADTNFFIDGLAKANILKSVPRDPLVNQTTNPCQGHAGEGYDYYYYRYTAATASNVSNGCQPRAFIILATDMETSTGRHPDSPGWDECTRDWHTNFDYVIGMYE